MSATPSSTPSRRATDQVTVTVTTIRLEHEDGVRRASAQGDFDTAVRETLSARLAPWAIDQVLGRVLARRPPAGEAVQYEGSFTPERQLRIAVQPVEPTDPPAPCRTRQLGGLSLPVPVDPTAVPATTEARRP